MIYGMPTLIELQDVEEGAKLCKELGLSFFEWNMNYPKYQLEQLEDISYINSLREQYGIGFTIHLEENLNVCDFNTAVSKAYLDTVARAIEAAKKIQAPIINMHMNHGIHITLPDRKVMLYEQYCEDYLHAWKEFRDLCERQVGDSGIKICIENTDGFKTYEKAAIDYLLQSDIFGLTWDIGHSHAVSNIDEEYLMSYKNRLCHFHIHDGLGKDNHMTLGTGDIDLRQRLKLAEECGCRCVLETKTIDALKRSVLWLRQGNIF